MLKLQTISIILIGPPSGRVAMGAVGGVVFAPVLERAEGRFEDNAIQKAVKNSKMNKNKTVKFRI